MGSQLVRMVVLAAAATAAFGCTPRIRIEWTRPARLQLPVDKPLALQVESDGAAPTATNVMDAVLSMGKGQVLNKWLAVPPVRDEFGAALRGAGYGLVEQAQAARVLKIRPTRWTYTPGKSSLRSGSGRLDAQIEVLDPQAPATPLFSESFWATAKVSELGEPEALLRASKRMAQAFLAELNPRRISAKVELDDSDPVAAPGIELCKQGQFDAAFEAFTDAVARAPTSAPAHYNLAVLTEARGAYDEAEVLLKKASGLNPKPLYYSALERVRRSRQDAQAMNAQ